MQKLYKDLKDIIHDFCDEDRIPKTIFGSHLSDLIMLKWVDSSDPVKWIESDQKLRLAFEDVYRSNAELSTVELYRGTDYFPNHQFKVGDTIPNTRFTSWTNSLLIALRFTFQTQPLIFRMSHPIKIMDISNYNKNEKEYIASPQQVKIEKITILPGGIKIIDVAPY